jgi:hypothetical protein
LGVVGDVDTIVERDQQPGISLGRGGASGVIDQNTPHLSCRDRKKLRAILPCGTSLIHERQKGVVHQCRCLQGVIRALATQEYRRHTVQLVEDRPRELIDRVVFAALRSLQQ